ncbi:HNH endonuclease [Corynebacterium pseudokroppenstedtii]|uniref:HNH endonuclease n=1 Tax=Corynebacterium pseudokroppenstedtii TaxID=2804917 RepID=A0AAU0Q0P6_9CORY|nr:HNH endonuclease [Corynebacterium pseudokroppenstedtii]MDU6478992.1 HNH endonuclease [Corynebacterium kroppenstedtii]MBY0791622.1 HNH endonuclease [Corynebacterium pseudokroppenstedtii]MCF6794438.1 HNH endonuclease [Corynebacterium pseudokroppenstedtii]MCF8703988.1 HNH endonuclease [Corynebacterium pseudokroppenstedtii]MCG2637495.1 HNH endonuclease [Corynebacterium pseudokroppenstedtii]
MNTHNPNKPETPRHLRTRIRQRDHYTCQLCGAPGREVDHIIPTSQGGTHTSTNLRVLCRTCHTRKTTRETRVGKTQKTQRLHLPPEPHPGIT